MNDTQTDVEMAIECLKRLLQDAPHSASPIPGDGERDELLGLQSFKNALDNYGQKPHLMPEFFRLAGIATRVRDDIQRAHISAHAVVC